jgi:hypothetical protein
MLNSLENWQSGRTEDSGATVLKRLTLFFYLLTGEMAERSNAAVLKTVEGHTSGGSNPSFSAKGKPATKVVGFLMSNHVKSIAFVNGWTLKKKGKP